ncbi:MAG TPA: type II secretion system F family protein [Stenomitos sp.]
MLLFIAIFTAITAAAFLFSGALAPQNAAIGGRIAELEGKQTAPLVGHGLLRRLSRPIEALIKGMSITRSLDRKLFQVGWAWTPGEFITAAGLLALAAGAIGGLLFANPLIGLVAALLGGAVPFLQLSQRRAKVLKELNEQLPDALMLVINGLRAGNSFLQSLMIVSKQMSGAIAQEFATTVSEINWGLPIETALSNLSERIGTLDIELVVAAMIIQRETGGNLSEILMNIHDTIRDRVRIAGEVQALTAQGRLSGIVLTCLPVGVGFLFFLISPGYLSVLFSDPRGHMLIAAAVGAQLLGIYFIRKLVNIKF